jgi:hypothetical protein
MTKRLRHWRIAPNSTQVSSNERPVAKGEQTFLLAPGQLAILGRLAATYDSELVRLTVAYNESDPAQSQFRISPV